MASVSIRTITKEELAARANSDRLAFINLENSRPILSSFGNPLGHVPYDEGAAIKALIRHWVAIYDVAKSSVLEPKYIISTIVGGREKIVGIAVEKMSGKFLSDFVLSKEPISSNKISENTAQVKDAANHFYEAMEKINKFGHYHGNLVPDLINVSFSSGTVSFQVGSPMIATSNAQQEEFLQSDKKRRNQFREMLRISDLEERRQFLSKLI
ncbi:MAG TPA: hypothetical protein VNF06_00395 [Candidatus Aquilonibacter sp.]|nr:hypothetical protein [Candidatus Aquilonibacter sp.]